MCEKEEEEEEEEKVMSIKANITLLPLILPYFPLTSLLLFLTLKPFTSLKKKKKIPSLNKNLKTLSQSYTYSTFLPHISLLI